MPHIEMKIIKHVCFGVHPQSFACLLCFFPAIWPFCYASYYLTQVLYFPHLGGSLVSQELLLLSVIWQTEGLLLKLDAFHECATSLISISPEKYLFFIAFFNYFPELRFMVSWCDYLRDAVRVSTLLLQTPQSHHPKGHEEKDYDR